MTGALASLLDECVGRRPSAAYAAKMLHAVATVPIVDREAWLLERVAGKTVLEFGASGPFHERAVRAAAAVVAFDRPGTSASGVSGFDLDDVTCGDLPQVAGAETILCGEVLEHLSNPGWFLTRLRRQYPGVPLLVSVPNAFSDAALRSILQGVEQVNRDHVAWYSPKTLEWLLARAGYQILEWAWYHGQPGTAEGLVARAE